MGQAVAAMGLDGLVERLQRGLGGGELGDVGGLAGRFCPASKSSALRMVAMPAEFDRDVGFGERMGDALVRADRRRPHLPLLGIVGGLADA